MRSIAADTAPGEAGTDAASSLTVSSRPATTRGARVSSPGSSASPDATATRLAARFPLSTEETYRGVSGCSDWVSYQL